MKTLTFAEFDRSPFKPKKIEFEYKAEEYVLITFYRTNDDAYQMVGQRHDWTLARAWAELATRGFFEAENRNIQLICNIPSVKTLSQLNHYLLPEFEHFVENGELDQETASRLSEKVRQARRQKYLENTRLVKRRPILIIGSVIVFLGLNPVLDYLMAGIELRTYLASALLLISGAFVCFLLYEILMRGIRSTSAEKNAFINKGLLLLFAAYIPALIVRRSAAHGYGLHDLALLLTFSCCAYQIFRNSPPAFVNSTPPRY